MKQKKVWSTIFLFLLCLVAFSAISYYFILRFNPASIYVGALMLSPTLAAFVTLKIKGRPISSLAWSLKKWKYIRFSYLTPIFYISIAYLLIWIFGFGKVPNENAIINWANELGIEVQNTSFVIFLMVLLLLTVGVLKNIGSTLGEEIGWRGFLIFELKKVFSFKQLSIISGLIWSIWHWPIIIYFGGGNTLFQIANFTIMIIGLSIILAYYTFKSDSLWPAALFHSVHNIYIQKICTPLTIYSENTIFWIDEYGIMLPIITTIFAIYFWKKAKKDNL